ncbi:hypothetical protein DXX93_02935 [Thalassotalea euphylliae]|uniref:DUF3325 domain-containing protein n=1 Tax=Thalassotalea euphylliae TaxID=1655234 RepID=A0A3E0TMN5_9GAMM|nr:hypothetical protein [Thalassotalea euphylliae]REL25607.1 hypothetical protein DXX93_02935 [Thalassotalea euphylliae]
MSFFINAVALFLCWVGSTSAYLTSERQQVLSHPLGKKLGWSVFSITLIAAFTLLLSLHHWLAAFLVLTVMVMLVWIALSLVIPYFPKQRRPLFYGTVLTIVNAVIGGFYVF